MSGIKGEIIRDEAGNIIRATGAKKTALTNKARYGENWYRELGRKGGSVSTPTGGFGYSHERAVAAGKKGGAMPRRTGVRNGYNRLADGRIVKREDKEE